MAYGLKASSCDPLKLLNHVNVTNMLYFVIFFIEMRGIFVNDFTLLNGVIPKTYLVLTGAK